MQSDDPDFETKATDVLGLYLNPPDHAAVFAVDEKTAIQALDHLDPYERGTGVAGHRLAQASPDWVLRAANNESVPCRYYPKPCRSARPGDSGSTGLPHRDRRESGTGREIHVIADKLSTHTAAVRRVCSLLPPTSSLSEIASHLGLRLTATSWPSDHVTAGGEDPTARGRNI